MLTADRYRLNILVPTLDIDLLWHTHQLSMYGYFVIVEHHLVIMLLIMMIKLMRID